MENVLIIYTFIHHEGRQKINGEKVYDKDKRIGKHQ